MGKSDRERPGIMIYFETLSTLEVLDDAEAGRLFKAALVYGSTGEIPAFEDRLMALAWSGMKSSIDRDGDRYSERKQRSRYSRYCGIERDSGREPLDYETWKYEIDESRRMLTTVDERRLSSTKPTNTTTTPAPAPTPTTTPATAATPSTTTGDGGAGGDHRVEMGNKKGSKGEVSVRSSLSDQFFPAPPPREKEYDDLRVERMAMLSDYMAKQGRTG